MIDAIIIDDEKHARDTIRMLLQSQQSELNIIAEAATVKEAVKKVQSLRPVVLFLDIDLPDGTGFDILQQIDYKKHKVIFITAHQQHAIKAIKFSAFDYILKPINPKELLQAVAHCLAEMQLDNYEDKFHAFFTNLNNTLPEQKKIVLKTSDKIHVVDIKNIVRCQADNAYTTVFTNTGKPILVSKNLKSFDDLLGSYGFIRTHQSHLINVNFISYFDKQDGGSLVMSDNTAIPVSNQKRAHLMNYLESL